MLGYPEKEVWGMTLYKISKLFEVHKEFNPDRFKQTKKENELDAIDLALGGL